MPAFKDITGNRYGRLVALGYAGDGRERCRCDCGTEKIIRRTALLGNTISCGCAHRDELVARNTIHGHNTRKGRTSAHARWAEAIQRCENPNNKKYGDYGGRGISVCEHLHDYETFFALLGEPPPGTLLDRIDNDGNYSCPICCPPDGNLRWATGSESAYNRRPKRWYRKPK